MRLFKRNRKDHWERVYHKHPPTEVGWYQAHPESSLKLINKTCADTHCKIIDVGGGTSLLTKCLLDHGYRKLTVLDISGNSIEKAKSHLGTKSNRVAWIEADITKYSFNDQFDVWHDRAVFHFLTKIEDRKSYVNSLNLSLKRTGHLILATFSPDGPPKCSGLPIVRYSPESLQNELGGNFHLAESFKEIHLTPSGLSQSFVYCRFVRQT